MDILELIKARRSIREFKSKDIDEEIVDEILEAGRWAPSGLNNQPWKFMVLKGEDKNSLAEYTKYFDIIKGANKIIMVFLNNEDSYNRDKDLMAIGACIQNILISIHSKGLGACWLGEILNQKDQIHKFLKTSQNLELAAVLALGYPHDSSSGSKRKKLKDLIIK
ncbi:MAG: nitroreductase [Candidatus Omnitrophica bacterium]|nr:nitroreductase [Candidatus Omnitrophota bacterium]